MRGDFALRFTTSRLWIPPETADRLCDKMSGERVGLMRGRCRNEQTPEGAAHTMGIEFTARAPVATHPAVVGSSSSKTTSAVNDGVPSMRTRKSPGSIEDQCGPRRDGSG